MSRKNERVDLSDKTREKYKTFVEYIENPSRHGAIGIICKMSPKTKELVKAKLLDEWQEVDSHLKEAIGIMNKVMGWFYDLPDGKK